MAPASNWKALAAIDIALWDLVGKALEQPIYQLLGGPFRTRIPCYTGLPGETVEERIAYARGLPGSWIHRNEDRHRLG